MSRNDQRFSLKLDKKNESPAFSQLDYIQDDDEEASHRQGAIHNDLQESRNKPNALYQRNSLIHERQQQHFGGRDEDNNEMEFQ